MITAPDSAPTPVNGLGWRALQERCCELSERLRCHAQPGGLHYPTSDETWRMRLLADQFADLAGKFSRLPSAEALEHDRLHFVSEFQELRVQAEQLLKAR